MFIATGEETQIRSPIFTRYPLRFQRRRGVLLQCTPENNFTKLYVGGRKKRQNYALALSSFRTRACRR